MNYVPVVDSNQNPLMPTTSSRARRWIKSGKATPFWKRGVFCVRLNQEPSGRILQEISIGVDPGSKKEGFTVKSKAHDYLHVQTDAVDWISQFVGLTPEGNEIRKGSLITRRNLRRSRRQRKTPCRKNRQNRARGGIPPSTKARWGWKLRILSWLKKMFPIIIIGVEDIAAKSKQFQKKWNSSFSPLEVGKKWFYQEVEKLGKLKLVKGFQTSKIRNCLGLKKLSNKLSTSFYAHCVDSWILASIGLRRGKRKPDNIRVLRIVPLRFHRRQLHVQVPAKGGIRKRCGGTRSLGFTRGSLVKHKKWGLAYVGGHSEIRISLHDLKTGKRITKSAEPEDCKFLTYSSWRFFTGSVPKKRLQRRVSK